MDFNKRQDRFDFFQSFDSPALNITFRLTTPDFLSFCKTQNLPVFHFFLFAVAKSLMDVENFRYRILDGQVIKIDKLYPSYTVLNKDGLFNYTHLSFTPHLENFISASLKAKQEAENSAPLINIGEENGVMDLKRHVFITSLPWLNFTSIQHPQYRIKNPDIPAIAWGKFLVQSDGTLEMPFSVMAHHGFVDGVHIHLLAEQINKTLQELMNR